MRKILSVVLALAIMMTVVSSMAFAATATNTYTGIVPTAGANSTTCDDSDGDGDYEVVLVAADNYPSFSINLNGTYAPANGGYLVVSYTVDFKYTTGNIITRPTYPTSSGNNVTFLKGALAADVYKFSYIYDIANNTIYPYINGEACDSATYTLPKAGSFTTHRFMPTIKNVSLNSTAMEVSGIKTEEYAAGEGVLAELQAAVVANDTPQEPEEPEAPEHPGGMEHKELTPTGISSYNTTVSGNTVTFSANDGRFNFDFGEYIKFDQSAEAAEVDYIRFHAELSSNDTTKGLYLRPHNDSNAATSKGLVCHIKNPNTVYKFDMIVDLANKTCDYYVNGAHIASETGTSLSQASINRARFWMYNNDRAPVFTVSNAYLEKFYAKNPVYASYAALKAACNTQEVDLDYAVATYDSTAEKYVLAAQMLGVDQDNHYNIIAGYDALGNLVFAQRYWPTVSGSNIEGVSQVASMKVFSWDAATLRPLMSVQNVTIN